MADRPRNIVICSCEDTMPLDPQAVRRGCGGSQVTTARQLCRAELDRYRAAVATGDALMVGCTQEAPLFSEIAATSRDADIRFANIRETAGWSADAANAAGSGLCEQLLIVRKRRESALKLLKIAAPA